MRASRSETRLTELLAQRPAPGTRSRTSPAKARVRSRRASSRRFRATAGRRAPRRRGGRRSSRGCSARRRRRSRAAGWSCHRVVGEEQVAVRLLRVGLLRVLIDHDAAVEDRSRATRQNALVELVACAVGNRVAQRQVGVRLLGAVGQIEPVERGLGVFAVEVDPMSVRASAPPSEIDCARCSGSPDPVTVA